MTPAEAEDLAARTVKIIDGRLNDLHPALRHGALNLNADRERVASDLAGLLDHDNVNDGDCGRCVVPEWGYPTHGHSHPQAWPCPDARRYADGLRRTAALYGLPPP